MSSRRHYPVGDGESIKCTIGLEHLRSQTPEGIQRELWTGLLTYNLVRAKMLQSSFTVHREIRSSSFTGTYQVLSSNWLLGACVGASRSLAMAFLVQGAVAIIGDRPNRDEPREN